MKGISDGYRNVVNAGNVRTFYWARLERWANMCPVGGARTLSRRDDKDSARGFNPGYVHIIDPPCLSAIVLGIRDEGGKGAADDSFRRFVRRLVNECRLYRPVGADPFWDVNPGLKPRAESCHPFGISPYGTKSRQSPYRPKSDQPTTPVMADYLYANQD
jgi:hypothetical protein